MTTQQDNRTRKMMTEYAGGKPVTCEQINSTLYVFGSELAVLRIFAKYNTNGAYLNPKARVLFSENRNSWAFSLELPSYALDVLQPTQP